MNKIEFIKTKTINDIKLLEHIKKLCYTDKDVRAGWVSGGLPHTDIPEYKNIAKWCIEHWLMYYLFIKDFMLEYDEIATLRSQWKATPHPNPLPQGARESGRSVILENKKDRDNKSPLFGFKGSLKYTIQGIFSPFAKGGKAILGDSILANPPCSASPP